MPSDLAGILRMIAWLAILGGAVLIATKLVGRVQAKVS